MKKQYILRFGSKTLLHGKDYQGTLNFTKRLNNIGSFEIVISNETPIDVNLQEPIQISVIKEGRDPQLLFVGWAVTALQTNDGYKITGMDLSKVIKERLISGTFSEALSSFDVAYHIAKHAGMKPNVPASSFGNGDSLYKVSIPITGFIAKDVFEILEVSFIPELTGDHLKSISSTKWKPLFETGLFATVEIEAKDFWEAHEKGSHKISLALDWLRIIQDYSGSQVDGKWLDWNISDYNSTLKQNPWFISSLIDKPDMWVILDSRQQNLIDKPQVNIEERYEHFDKMTDTLSKNDKVVFTLHFLRRAKSQITDHIYALSDIFVALESLLSHVKGETLFEKNELEEVLSEYKKQNEDELKNERLKQYLSRINEPSFRKRLDIFTNDNNIEISESDLQFITKYRTIRNDIVHRGKKPNIPRKDIEKLIHIIETLVISCLSK